MKTFLAWLLLTGVALGAEKLNIVLILADDLGWSDLSCTGSAFYETPAIDRLAKQGMKFTQAYAGANVCSPSRAAIMTGKYPARLHTTNFFGGNRRGKLLPPEYLQSLPAEEITIAKALQEQGYRTGHFGKWHLGNKGSQPQDFGFEVVVGLEMGPGRGPADDPHFSRQLSEAVVKFMAETKDKPFFVYLPLHSVHVPLKTRPELLAKYEAKAAKLPAKEPREVPVNDHKARAVQDHPVYAGMVQEMDEAVARVLKALDDLKLTGNTLVLFTSDNGGLSTAEGSPTCNLPLRAGKGWNYEGGIRVPLIVRLPGRVPSGALCDVPVIHCDFYPTLLAMAGLTVPAEQKVDGVNFAPLLEQKGGIADRPLFWHYPHYSNQGGRPCGAVRAGNYKLLEFFEDNHIEEYDLADDPGEQQNHPHMPEVLLPLLRDWRQSVGAQMPTPNPNPVEPFGPQGKTEKAKNKNKK
jgi:arylsulfatase A-like enzyme